MKTCADVTCLNPTDSGYPTCTGCDKDFCGDHLFYCDGPDKHPGGEGQHCDMCCQTHMGIFPARAEIIKQARAWREHNGKDLTKYIAACYALTQAVVAYEKLLGKYGVQGPDDAAVTAGA